MVNAVLQGNSRRIALNADLTVLIDVHIGAGSAGAHIDIRTAAGVGFARTVGDAPVS